MPNERNNNGNASEMLQWRVAVPRETDGSTNDAQTPVPDYARLETAIAAQILGSSPSFTGRELMVDYNPYTDSSLLSAVGGITNRKPSKTVNQERTNMYQRVMLLLQRLEGIANTYKTTATEETARLFYREKMVQIRGLQNSLALQRDQEEAPTHFLVVNSHVLPWGIADWVEFFELNKFRPVPKVVQLRAVKDATVECIVRGQTWTKANEMKLHELCIKAGKQFEEVGEITEALSNTISAEKNRRRRYHERQYTFKKGPYTSTVTIPLDYLDTMERLKGGLHGLRQQISHDRVNLATSPDAYTVITGHFGVRKAGVYTEPGSVIKKGNTVKLKEVFENKVPKGTNAHVGIELEFCSKTPPDQLASLLFKANLAPYVTLKADGSLRVSANGHFSHEICILAAERSYKEIVQRVCKVLIASGGYVNKTCGMHVHLDMRKIAGSGRTPEKSYKRLVKSLNILYAVIPPTRRESTYAKRNTLDSEFNAHDSSDRYWAINDAAFSRHKTIEVRLHSGTLLPRKINNWIALLIKIADTPNEVNYKSVTRFAEAFKLDEELTAYLTERAAKFNMEGHDDEDEHVKKVIGERRGSTPLGSTGPVTPLGQCACSDCQRHRVVSVGGMAPFAEALAAYQGELQAA